MQKLVKIPVLVAAAMLCCVLSGCPGKDDSDVKDVNFQVGTWAGSIVTEAKMVLREEPQYWCAAWKMEAADIRLEQYQDGSLKGTAKGNLFHWSVYDSKLLTYTEIAGGHWDSYGTFTIELTGQVDESSYTLEAVELPLAVPDQMSAGSDIQFWDFLFPLKMQGDMPTEERLKMSGESIRPQGNDYRETSSQANFREFSINYTWNIEKL